MEKGKVWISSILDEYQNADVLEGGFTSEIYLNFQLRTAKRKPFSGFGFIKASFWEACEAKGGISLRIAIYLFCIKVNMKNFRLRWFNVIIIIFNTF